MTVFLKIFSATLNYLSRSSYSFIRSISICMLIEKLKILNDTIALFGILEHSESTNAVLCFIFFNIL